MGTREAGIGGPQEREQVAPAAAEPRVADDREQRTTEGRMRRPERPVERVGNAERTEGRLQGRAQALDRRADDQDLLRRRAGAEELEDLVGDQLERGAGAGALEQADRALGRRRRRRRILEQSPLEVGEGRVRVVGVARRQLLDPPGCEPRQVGCRTLERREGEPPGLVLQRHGDVHPPRERLEQSPLRAAQVLEAVGVDRTAVPGGELVRDPARGVAAPKVAVPETEPVELLAISPVELGEVAVDVLGLQQPRFELRNRGAERVAESRESRRRVELAERRSRHHSAQDQRALRVSGDRLRSAVPGRDPLEDVVERPDRSAEQCSRADEQIALDPFDVRPGRHDQDRLPGQIGEVTIEEQSHFAGVGRPGQQRQGHRPILVPRSDGSAYAAGRETGKEREKREQSSGTGRTRPRGSFRLLRTWACDRGERSRARACSSRTNRRDLLLLRRAEHRKRTGASSRPFLHPLPCCTGHRRERSFVPIRSSDFAGLDPQE